MAAAALPILDDGHLRTLAELLWRQEVINIHNIQFQSGIDRDKYLYDSKSCYDLSVTILNVGVNVKSKYALDATRSPISTAVGSYLIHSMNLALQTVNNYSLRLDFLQKLSDHSGSLSKQLGELDTSNTSLVAEMAGKTSQSNRSMLGYLHNYKSAASAEFSRYLKSTGTTFEMLVQRYQGELSFEGQFENLEDNQKLQVYDHIIEASGRGAIRSRASAKAIPLGPAEVATLILAAGTMVWDIFTADHVIQAVVKDAVNALLAVGGAILTTVVTTAIGVAGALSGVEASALFVVTTGITAGIGAAVFLVCAAAGWLISLIFSSGGRNVPSTDGIHTYGAPMPDGVSLARQLVHG